ncbi:hypothetical protein INT43_002996 [Umbelopsis isabellina]|uniref:RRM domain-containing protein n=1 Tax=Mortierella isabellina TaxID=91625 RepID=A0A8H7PP03_MORIS|nr:hypothetical protein INT43_002996 [Umbelopsis isabellina]
MFVGGLNWETTDERLRDYFSKFGEVLDCVVMRDSATGKSRGFAFLTFADSRVVDDVASRPHQLDGKNIDPKRAVPRDEQDKTEKIFVGGIHQDVDEEEFRDYFSQFGKVIDVTLMTDRATGRPRGFGFVTFESSQGVDNALHMTGLAMRGKPVEVKKAMPKHRQQQQGQGGDSHGGVAVNPYFNMYGKQGGSRYAGAANSMAGGNQGGRGGWYGGAGAGGNNGGMYGNYYGGGGNYPQNYQMMAAAAAAYYNRYMGYYQQQQQQQSNYDQGGYQEDSYEEGNDGGNDYSDQDRGSGGDQYSSSGQTDRYNDGGRGNHSRDPRRDPRSSSSSYSSGNDRNSRGNSGSGGGGAVYASQSNRNHHNYRPY